MYHPVVSTLKSLLESSGVSHSFFEHEAVRTSEEASDTRPEYSLSQGAKALIVSVKLRDGSSKLCMIVVPGDQKFSAKKVKKILDAKSIRFATQEEADSVTGGVEFGGVPPFGSLFGIETIVDPALLEHDDIIFNCGDRRCSIAITSDDYIKVLGPLIKPVI